MKLILKSSGGIGGLRFEGALDTADLPAELAQRTEEHLSSENLKAASGARSKPASTPFSMSTSIPTPDAQQYEIHLLPEHEDGAIERHIVTDMCPVGEVLDVIDDLLAEVVQRKADAAND